MQKGGTAAVPGFVPPLTRPFLTEAHNAGARIHTNSWGTGPDSLAVAAARNAGITTVQLVWNSIRKPTTSRILQYYLPWAMMLWTAPTTRSIS